MVITSLIMIANIQIEYARLSQSALGQAEETFGLNTTFFEEVEEKQKKQQVAISSMIEPTHGKNVQMSANDTSQPKLLISGENVYVVWGTNETGNWEVMFRASNDNGKIFGDKVNLSNSTATDSANIETVVSGSRVFVYWQEIDSTNGSRDYVLRLSQDMGQTFEPILHLSDNGTIGEMVKFSNISTYYNPDYAFQIKHPSVWQVREDVDANNSRVIEVVRFVSPFEYRLDLYRERLSISLDNLSAENITLAKYSDDVILFKNRTLEDFHLIDQDTTNTVLGGYPGYRLLYLAHQMRALP